MTIRTFLSRLFVTATSRDQTSGSPQATPHPQSRPCATEHISDADAIRREQANAEQITLEQLRRERLAAGPLDTRNADRALELVRPTRFARRLIALRGGK